MRFVERGVLVASLASLVACNRSASDAELTAWLDEAHRAELVRREARDTQQEQGWTLSLRGNVRGGAIDFTWRQLDEMATTHLKTTNPGHTSNVNEVLDYRGIAIPDLLTTSGAYEGTGPGAGEIVVVAADGFIGVRSLALARQIPMMLALDENGVPLTRNKGGPLLEIFPLASHAAQCQPHREGGAFYVTHIIVGTEALALRVGSKKFTAADVDALPEHAIVTQAGFRRRSPTTPVKIHGVTVRDLLARANVVFTPSDDIVVSAKPRTQTKEHQSVSLQGKDVLACDILVGVRIGEDRALIPANLGGPAVLAFPPSCASASGGAAWPQFVEAIDVARRVDEAPR